MPLPVVRSCLYVFFKFVAVVVFDDVVVAAAAARAAAVIVGVVALPFDFRAR